LSAKTNLKFGTRQPNVFSKNLIFPLGVAHPIRSLEMGVVLKKFRIFYKLPKEAQKAQGRPKDGTNKPKTTKRDPSEFEYVKRKRKTAYQQDEKKKQLKKTKKEKNNKNEIKNKQPTQKKEQNAKKKQVPPTRTQMTQKLTEKINPPEA
jgi:hypothetical protein